MFAHTHTLRRDQLTKAQPVYWFGANVFHGTADAVIIQPQGVMVEPTLFAVTPTGINILPQGVAVGANGFVEASTGVNVQPAGVSWAPVNHDRSG